uniref:Uncharacterized protein n=1 Tax=Trypanosoma congolense (strain IL3000) TaxID=1068625 RepID=G0UMV6_TRYCI|nr:hypothetical protein, unlikely [Trypanosoma congolense IL3000]
MRVESLLTPSLSPSCFRYLRSFVIEWLRANLTGEDEVHVGISSNVALKKTVLLFFVLYAFASPKWVRALERVHLLILYFSLWCLFSFCFFLYVSLRSFLPIFVFPFFSLQNNNNNYYY